MNSFALNQKSSRLFIALIVVTFLFKVLLATYFSYLGDCKNPELSIGYLAKPTGDTFAYLGTIDNLVTEGNYYFWNGVRKVYAGRMPYYGSPYFVFRLFSDKPLASDLLVLLQIFLDTLATVYFARLCLSVFKRQGAFWIGFFLYLLSFNFFATVLQLAPESFSMSFMVLFFYAFHQWWSGESKSLVWVANLCITLAFLLKPYFAFVYIAFWLLYLYKEDLLKVAKYKAFFIKSVLFGLPLVVLLSPWFLRNVIALKQPIATQEGYLAGYNYTEPDLAFKRFTAGWGGDIAWWDSKSPACYFKLNPPFACDFAYPSYSMTSGYSLQDVEDVRAIYLEYQRNPSPELEQEVISGFDRLTDIYKAERPFMFYIGSSFVRLKTMLWHTNNYNLPIHITSRCFEPYQVSFKVIQSILWGLALILGFPGLIWLTLQRRVSFMFLFAILSVAGVTAFYARFAEARYLSHGYPLMLLGLVAIVFLVYSIIEKSLTGIKTNSDKLN